MQFSKQLLCIVAFGAALTACNYNQSINDSAVFPPAGQPAAPVYFQVTPDSQPYDISELLTSVKEGDSVYAVQLIDTFMARMAKNPQAPPMPPQFKKGDKIVTTLKVLKVFKNAQEAQADEAKERETAFRSDKNIQQQLTTDDKTIQSYLSEKNIPAKKVGMGTYVQVLSQGNGPQVTDGKYVSLKYKGQTFEGKVFDTNMDDSFKHTDPLSFVVGGSPMIKGFEEGIKGLNKGAKARLYIPSSLAYGTNTPSPDIKANENLIFDIEVLDVADQAPTANMPGSPNPGGAGR
jgi:FKBP-type peptidyl-prolyl cis-trans isomerase